MAEMATVWKAHDGKLFDGDEAEEQCRSYEARLGIIDSLENHKLYGNTAGSYVEAADLLYWLDKNRTAVLAYYNVSADLHDR